MRTNHTSSNQNRFLKSICIFVFLTITGTYGFSQNAIFSTELLILKDTATLGGNDTVSIRIRNVGNTTYNGYLNIYYTTDTISYSPILLCSIPSVQLAATDTINSTCVINFDSTFFHPQDNIVVVWSSGAGKFAADSLIDHIYLYPLIAGIYENDLNSSFALSPSPAKDFISIKTSLLNNTIKQISVTDLYGRPNSVKYVNSAEDQRIDIHSLPAGIYFANVKYQDGKTAVRKFVKLE